MTTIGRFGNYVAHEDFVDKTIFPQRTVAIAEDGTEEKESMRVKLSKRRLILTHDTGDKVAFTIGRFGKRLTYKDSRVGNKRTVEFDYCIAEVSRMLDVTPADAAALLSAHAMFPSEAE